MINAVILIIQNTFTDKDKTLCTYFKCIVRDKSPTTSVTFKVRDKTPTTSATFKVTDKTANTSEIFTVKENNLCIYLISTDKNKTSSIHKHDRKE